MYVEFIMEVIMESCKEHSGHEARLRNLELDGADMKNAISSSHRRIDGMKNWVIAGMSSMIIQLVIAIIGVIIILSRSGR